MHKIIYEFILIFVIIMLISLQSYQQPSPSSVLGTMHQVLNTRCQILGTRVQVLCPRSSKLSILDSILVNMHFYLIWTRTTGFYPFYPSTPVPGPGTCMVSLHVTVRSDILIAVSKAWWMPDVVYLKQTSPIYHTRDERIIDLEISF